MTTKSLEIKSTLTDEQIVQVAMKIDQMIADIGAEFRPNGIEFAAIALGRLMVFAKHVDIYDTFQQMMEEVVKLKEPEPLSKTQDVQV